MAGAQLDESAHALAEGSFAGRRGSWLVSGRRGFVDFLLGVINNVATSQLVATDFLLV